MSRESRRVFLRVDCKENNYESRDDPRCCGFSGQRIAGPDISRNDSRDCNRRFGSSGFRRSGPARNVNTGLERTTQTSSDGSYSVPELPIGTYMVTVSQSGFQTSATTGVIVDVAGERRVDVSLRPGQVAERVE